MSYIRIRLCERAKEGDCEGMGCRMRGRMYRRRHNGQHLLIKSSQVARQSVLKSYYLVFGDMEEATSAAAAATAASCCSALEHNVMA